MSLPIVRLDCPYLPNNAQNEKDHDPSATFAPPPRRSKVASQQVPELPIIVSRREANAVEAKREGRRMVRRRKSKQDYVDDGFVIDAPRPPDYLPNRLRRGDRSLRRRHSADNIHHTNNDIPLPSEMSSERFRRPSVESNWSGAPKPSPPISPQLGPREHSKRRLYMGTGAPTLPEYGGLTLILIS